MIILKFIKILMITTVEYYQIIMIHIVDKHDR